MALYRHPELGYYEGRDSQADVLSKSGWLHVTDDQGQAVPPPQPDTTDDTAGGDEPGPGPVPGSPEQTPGAGDDQAAVSEQFEIRELDGAPAADVGPSEPDPAAETAEPAAPTTTSRRTTAKKG